MADIQELGLGDIDQVSGAGLGGFIVGALAGGLLYDIVKGVANGDITPPPTPNLGFH